MAVFLTQNKTPGWINENWAGDNNALIIVKIIHFSKDQMGIANLKAVCVLQCLGCIVNYIIVYKPLTCLGHISPTNEKKEIKYDINAEIKKLF